MAQVFDNKGLMSKQGGPNPRMAAKTGRAGEHAVAAQLLLRDVSPAWPSVDEGFDLLTPNGCRIQVRTAHLRCTPSILKIYPFGVYSFHFPRKRHLATSSREVRTTERKSLVETCDVVALWGIEGNRFWVAPSHLFAAVQCIFLGPENKRAFDEALPEMQSMVDMGFSQKAIGEHMGITQGSVGRRLERAGTQKRGDRAACMIRNCENAWEHILDFGAVVAETPREVLQNA